MLNHGSYGISVGTCRWYSGGCCAELLEPCSNHMKIARSHGLGNQPPSMALWMSGETTSQHLKHGIVSTINNPKKLDHTWTILKRTSKPCKQAKYDRLQLVVLVICGYMLPASTFGAWTVNLFITKPLYNLVSWESARRVFGETLQDQPRCKHPRFIVIIVIVTIVIHPRMKSDPNFKKSLTIAHIVWCTVCRQCTRCWPRFIPSP